MTKVITDIELLKKLYPHLEDVETEYIISGEDTEWKEDINANPESYECDYQTFYIKKGEVFGLNTKNRWRVKNIIKTLTTDEAIELLNKVKRTDLELYFEKNNLKRTDVLFYILGGGIELILYYLLDNNLLGIKST